MHTRRPQHQPNPLWKRAALLVALVALVAIPATLVYGQNLSGWVDWTDECERIEGTIRVADDMPHAAMMQLARVTETQARDAALATLAGATVTEIDLDDEDGFLIYEVDLLKDGAEYDVTVDAGDGRVLCSERD
jgi:hypothetical protein